MTRCEIGRPRRRLSIMAAVWLSLVSLADAGVDGLGLFAPELNMTPYEYFDQVDRLARYLSTITGRQFKGRAYKRAADFEMDLRNGRVTVAILGAFYHAARSRSRRHALLVRAAGATRQWTLMTYAATKKPPFRLKGRTLFVPQVATAATAFVEHGLLRSHLKLSRFFRVKTAPTIASALAAARLVRDPLVFAPRRTEGLQPAVDLRLGVPPPVVVYTARRPADAELAQLRRALLDYRGKAGVLRRFAAGQPQVYARLGAMRAPNRMRLKPVAPAPIHFDDPRWFREAARKETAPTPSFDTLFVTPRARGSVARK